MDVGLGGQAFLNRWLKHTEDEKESGTCKACSYWGWQGGRRNFYSGECVFSFARILVAEWLFFSVAQIIDTPTNDWGGIQVLDSFKPYFPIDSSHVEKVALLTRKEVT